METLKPIIGGALERLSQQIRTDLAPLLAALMILLIALLAARLLRWLVTRAFKGIQADQWLRRSGISEMIDRSGTLRTSRLLAEGVYWAVLIAGGVAALNVFGGQFTVRLADWFVLLLPRVVAAAAVVLAGVWLGRFTGRSVLVWAVNEDVPAPRKLAVAVRLLVVFVSIAIAADVIDFAPGVFLAALVLVLGGVVLAASLALGLGAREEVRRYFAARAECESAPDHDGLGERSLWNQL